MSRINLATILLPFGKNLKRFEQLVLLLGILFQLDGQAATVDLGRIDFTGSFTLNHNFDFNQPSAYPFGTFGNLTVESATGIFASDVSPRDLLTMNTLNFGWVAPMQWSIDGFSFNTISANITGADFAGRLCLGFTDLSGNGFDPSSYPYTPLSYWHFTAPPYDITRFHSDITGPITLTFDVSYDDHRIPDGAGTAILLALGLAGLATCRRKSVV